MRKINLFGRVRFQSIFLCLISALFLGISQPLFVSPIMSGYSFGQKYLGLFCLIGYVPIFYLLSKSTRVRCFLWCLLTFSIQYSIVYYWIFIAVNVHGGVSPLPSAMITFLLAVIIAVKGGIFFSTGHFLANYFRIPFLWLMPPILCALEYFRNYFLFGGYPWGNVGYSIARVDQFLQLASIFGVYGLVFFVGVVNVLVLLLIQEKQKRTLAGLCLVSLLALSFGFGQWRLNEGEKQFAKTIRIALVQGNIPQAIKSEASLHRDKIIKIYNDLSETAVKKGAQLILWPESAYPGLQDENIERFLHIKNQDVPFVIGATCYGKYEGESRYHAHNSAFVIERFGRISHRYDKSHLVPFGEYVPWPLRDVVQKIVPGMGAFRPGKSFEPQKIQLYSSQKLKVGTTICYEGIFPEITRKYANNGARLFLNLTNDAWYGYSSAPYQHLLMYRLRSVETGRAFLRATNSGVSAIIDPYGNIKKHLGLFERGVIVEDVPMLSIKTIYLSVGDILPFLCLFGLLLAFLAALVPLRHYFAFKQYLAATFSILVICLAVGAQVYFHQEKFAVDESAATKGLFILIFCLILLRAAKRIFLSRSPR